MNDVSPFPWRVRCTRGDRVKTRENVRVPCDFAVPRVVAVRSGVLRHVRCACGAHVTTARRGAQRAVSPCNLAVQGEGD